MRSATGRAVVTAAVLGSALAYMSDDMLNLAGGCCGNTPEHIAAIAEAVAHVPPRQVPVVG